MIVHLAQLFAEKGITSIEHADFDGVERLAAVTGGAAVPQLPPLPAVLTRVLAQARLRPRLTTPSWCAWAAAS